MDERETSQIDFILTRPDLKANPPYHMHIDIVRDVQFTSHFANSLLQKNHIDSSTNYSLPPPLHFLRTRGILRLLYTMSSIRQFRSVKCNATFQLVAVLVFRILLLVHQVLELGLVRQLHLDEPAFVIGAAVHLLKQSCVSQNGNCYQARAK